MDGISIQDRDGQKILSQAMRQLRRARGLRTGDVARRMEMPLRSYERMEAGQVAVGFDRIEAFAKATDSDASALALAVMLQSSAFAVRCADNKLAMILTLTLRELDNRLGDDILFLEPKFLINAFARMVDQLHENILARDLFAETWLADRGADRPQRRG